MSNWNPRSRVIVVLIAASALVGCGGGSGGSSDVIVPADGRPANPDWAQLDPAMKDTLSAIAEQYGISREDARQRVGWQNAFAMAAGGIEEKYPNAFSRAEITNQLPARTVIFFKGPVPPDVASILVTVPREVEIRLSGGREFTSEEIAQRVSNAMHAANDTGLIHATSAPSSITTPAQCRLLDAPRILTSTNGKMRSASRRRSTGWVWHPLST